MALTWGVFQMGGDPGISAFPEEDNIFCWKGTITGSKETVFEGTEYRLSLSFSNDYPFKPPKVKFETCCFHPNVDVYGNICLDILQVKMTFFLCLSTTRNQRRSTKLNLFFTFSYLQDKWSSAYDVRTILLSIQSLLGGNLSCITFDFLYALSVVNHLIRYLSVFLRLCVI